MRFNFGSRTHLLAALVTILPTAFMMIATSEASAQTAKVVKVSGKKAIVQFPDEARPHVGQMIDLSGGVVSMGSAARSNGPGGREMIIGGSAEISSLTPSGAASSTTVMAAEARYGWNAGIMEYGALGSFYYMSTTGTSRRKLEAGGFFDYNLVPNTAGTEIVYGGMATAKFGQLANTSVTSELSGTLMTLEVGGQLKWFPLGNTVAVRGDLLYRMESVSDTVRAYATGSGIVAKGGFYIYF